MPKPKKVIRPVEKRINLPEDLVARVDLMLWSDVEQRVPFGAWSELTTRLLKEYLDQHQQQGQ